MLTPLPGLLLGLAYSPYTLADDDPFAALARETRPLETRWQTDYSGGLELGLQWVSNDNFMFGQYSGLSEQKLTTVGNFSWSGDRGGKWLDLRGTDLGLDTRNASLRWGVPGQFELYFELDSQKQIRNDSGVTPFSGPDNLLPEDWVSSNVTSGFTALEGNTRTLKQDMERDIWSGGFSASLTDNWDLSSTLRYEERDGNTGSGGAIFTNLSAGLAAILPMQVDYETTEFDLKLDYQDEKLQLSGSWLYSDFENSDDLLRWRNPYTSFEPRVDYPDGEGGIALAPDNDQHRLRLTGVYIFSHQLRFQVDGSYARTEQDQSYADYTVNEDLLIFEPLPRNSLDISLDTSTLDARIFYRPAPKLNLEAFYHGEERDYDGPRDGYRPVLGDGEDQSVSAATVYNTWQDYTVNKAGVEASHRLPWRSKIWLGYEYEKRERRNAAVEKTEEDIYTLRYRIRALSSLSATLNLLYADRAADTYQWDQSYYALLDAELINQTPENRRYINHPLLSQYHLANRERSEAKLDLSWQPAADWQLAANLLYREDDFDKSDLGLTDEELLRLGLTASWLPHPDLTVSAWASYDQYETQQGGRSFRGGIEKNAFATYPPFPQASDPSRNWDTDIEDSTVSLGFSTQWQLREDISLNAEYSYVGSEGQYDFSTGGAADLDPESLPDNESTQHHFVLEAAWHVEEKISIKFDYQYWSYDADDWAIHDITPTTIDAVLTLGEQEADEDLHYVGTTIVFRWQ